jgi:hypothetical protein
MSTLMTFKPTLQSYEQNSMVSSDTIWPCSSHRSRSHGTCHRSRSHSFMTCLFHCLQTTIFIFYRNLFLFSVVLPILLLYTFCLRLLYQGSPHLSILPPLLFSYTLPHLISVLHITLNLPFRSVPWSSNSSFHSRLS